MNVGFTMLVIVLIGCCFGALIMFVDLVVKSLYAKIKDFDAIQKLDTLGPYSSAVLAGFSAGLIAVVLFAPLIVFATWLLRDVVDTRDLTSWFKQLSPISVFMGMAVAGIVRRRWGNRSEKQV